MRNEQSISITFGELSDRWGMSDKVCEVLGVNPWCLNEGLATKEDTIGVTESQARQIGISEQEFEDRIK